MHLASHPTCGREVDEPIFRRKQMTTDGIDGSLDCAGRGSRLRRNQTTIEPPYGLPHITRQLAHDKL